MAEALQLLKHHRLMDAYVQMAMQACGACVRARLTNALVRLRVARLHMGMGRWDVATDMLTEAAARFKHLNDWRHSDLTSFYLLFVGYLHSSAGEPPHTNHGVRLYC